MTTTPPPPPPPPPPPGGGRPGPTAGGLGFDAVDVGAAFGFAWEAFRARAGQLVLWVVVAVLGVTVASVVWFVAAALLARRGGPTGVVGGVLVVVGAVVLVVGILLLQGATVRATLDVVDGRALDRRRVLATDQLGAIVGTALLVALGVVVGTLLCYLPGLVFQFLSAFAIHFVVDERMRPVEAIRASVQLVRAAPGGAVVLVLATSLAASAGGLLCGIGLVVSLPVAYVAQAHGFRQLRGQPVATA